MAAWPATLPQSVHLADFSEQKHDGRIRTAMDAGPDFMRRRFSAVPVNFGGSMVLTASQMTTLETFIDTTLNGGTDSFTWVHPRTGSAITARFAAMPSFTAITDDTFQTQFAFEILP